MLAAQKAKKDLNLLAIGLLSSQQNKKPTKEALINTGADSVIHDPQELLFFIP
jgi:phosphoglycolate phosphatase-like HAD superfamily hydrolase